MKSYLMIAVLILFAVGCEPKKEEAPKSISDMFDRYYEENLKLNPFEASQTGDSRYNDVLPNTISDAYRQETRDFYVRYQNELKGFDRATLTVQEQMSYDVFEREMQASLDQLNYPDNLIPLNQMFSMASIMPQMGSGQSFQPFVTAQDYDNFLKRIDGFIVWSDTAIVNMKKGIALGYTLPKPLMEKVVPQLKSMIVTDPKQSIFYQPIANMPEGISAEDKTRLTDAYTKTIQEKLIPTYIKLHDFVRDEYLPKARTSSGIDALPNGKERYQTLIRLFTTTDLSADSIFNLGIAEVARITGEMEKVKNEIGFKGDLKAFFNYISTDKKFMPFNTDEEVITAFKDIEKKIEPTLSSMFNMKPKTDFEVRQIEEFREASASAGYNQGTPDGSRPGIFYVPVLDPKKFNSSGMETLFLHEAIPGHHYQVSLQQENQDLPKFRRTLGYGAYSEGWALYAESLGKDLGMLTDPIQYFGHLGDEMHRAIRLVVDVGLHAKGWTREQAIKYMMDNEPIAEQGAVAEIERYMSFPGQALCYKVGQLKITELREKAKKELGDKFQISLFHDEVLKYGSLPLDILEQRINEWIKTTQSNA